MKTILLVDDDEVTRTLIIEVLGQKYQVIEASNGQKGLNLFKANKSKIKLVITDFSMPCMSGFDMVRAIRALSSTVKIIIFSSSISEPERLFRATALSINKFLPKSATFKDIREATKDLLES
jgi:CheY-like chemotaxis protein